MLKHIEATNIEACDLQVNCCPKQRMLNNVIDCIYCMLSHSNVLFSYMDVAIADRSTNFRPQCILYLSRRDLSCALHDIKRVSSESRHLYQVLGTGDLIYPGNSRVT